MSDNAFRFFWVFYLFECELFLYQFIFQSFVHALITIIPAPPILPGSTLSSLPIQLCVFFVLTIQDQFTLHKYSCLYDLPLPCGPLTSVYTLRENCHLSLSFSQQLTSASNSSSRSEIVCPTPFLHVGIWSGLQLHRSFTGYQNYLALTCAAALLCPKAPVSLQASSTSGSYVLSASSSTMTPYSWVCECSIYVPFGAEHSPVSYLSTLAGSGPVCQIIIYCIQKLLQ